MPLLKLQDLTHLPAPAGKISFVSVYNISDETGQLNLTRQVTFHRLCRRRHRYVGHCAEDSRWFIRWNDKAYRMLLNERKIIRAAGENGTVAMNNQYPASVADGGKYYGGRFYYIGYMKVTSNPAVGAR